MTPRGQALPAMMAILASAVLLFVVIYPYTPTPIAVNIGKILVATFVFVITCLLMTCAASRIDSYARADGRQRTFLAGRILSLICLQLR
jgi:hypothetical protein